MAGLVIIATAGANGANADTAFQSSVDGLMYFAAALIALAVVIMAFYVAHRVRSGEKLK